MTYQFQKDSGGVLLPAVLRQKELFQETKGPSIWDYWYEQEPGKFFDRVGPEKHPKSISGIKKIFN